MLMVGPGIETLRLRLFLAFGTVSLVVHAVALCGGLGHEFSSKDITNATISLVPNLFCCLVLPLGLRLRLRVQRRRILNLPARLAEFGDGPFSRICPTPYGIGEVVAEEVQNMPAEPEQHIAKASPALVGVEHEPGDCSMYIDTGDAGSTIEDRWPLPGLCVEGEVASKEQDGEKEEGETESVQMQSQQRSTMRAPSGGSVMSAASYAAAVASEVCVMNLQEALTEEEEASLGVARTISERQEATSLATSFDRPQTSENNDGTSLPHPDMVAHLQGAWREVSGSLKVRPFLRSFVITGRVWLGGDGTDGWLTLRGDDSAILLEGGVLSIEQNGAILSRVGKSGTELLFERHL